LLLYVIPAKAAIHYVVIASEAKQSQLSNCKSSIVNCKLVCHSREIEDPALDGAAIHYVVIASEAKQSQLPNCKSAIENWQLKISSSHPAICSKKVFDYRTKNVIII